MGEYRADQWQIKVDPLGYPSVYETNEDGDPGDLVCHAFTDHVNLIAGAPDLLKASEAVVKLIEGFPGYGTMSNAQGRLKDQPEWCHFYVLVGKLLSAGQPA